jgi:hypothetical protein
MNSRKYGCSLLHSPGPTPLAAPVRDRVPSGIIATSLWFPHLTLIRMFLRFVTCAAKFIADSSPLASVVALSNAVGLTSLALSKGGSAYEAPPI